MKLTYDPQHNVAYFQLADRPADVETLHISDELNIDIAPDGTVYGIELLNADSQLGGHAGNQLIFVNESTGKESALPFPLK